MSRLTNKLYTNKRKDFLLSPDVINALDNIDIDFVVILIEKATGNIALVFEIFYASVITRKLELNRNSFTDTYNNTGALSENHIIGKNIRNQEVKFGIDNIPI